MRGVARPRAMGAQSPGPTRSCRAERPGRRTRRLTTEGGPCRAARRRGARLRRPRKLAQRRADALEEGLAATLPRPERVAHPRDPAVRVADVLEELLHRARRVAVRGLDARVPLGDDDRVELRLPPL